MWLRPTEFTTWIWTSINGINWWACLMLPVLGEHINRRWTSMILMYCRQGQILELCHRQADLRVGRWERTAARVWSQSRPDCVYGLLLLRHWCVLHRAFIEILTLGLMLCRENGVDGGVRGGSKSVHAQPVHDPNDQQKSTGVWWLG